MRELFEFLEESRGPAFVRRLKWNLAVAVPGVPLLNLLLTPLGLDALWLQLPVAVAWAFLAAHFRFTGFLSGAALLGAEIVLLVLGGPGVTLGGEGPQAIGNLTFLLGLVFFFAVGVALGVLEEGRIGDGH